MTSEILFASSLDGVTEEILSDVVGEVPTKSMDLVHKLGLLGTSPSIINLVVSAGLEPSRGAARKSLEAGGVYLNNVRVDHARAVTPADLLFGKYLLLRKGKKLYAVLT